jgi:hypothetical protein
MRQVRCLRYRASVDVDFRSLDFIVDELPAGDIVFIRQVLQHLSNEQINRALQKLSTHFKYLVLTEHLPGIPEFAPNLDKPAGPGIRTGLPSGIVLTKAPFNLKPYLERRLCHVAEDGGIIATTLYQLMPN